MPPRITPLRWNNVNAPNQAAALDALNRSGQQFGTAIQGIGGAISDGANQYADSQTDAFLAELNAAPDDATRKQMVADASQAFLHMDQVNKGVTDAQNQDFAVAAEGRAVTRAGQEAKLFKQTFDQTELTNPLDVAILNAQADNAKRTEALNAKYAAGNAARQEEISRLNAQLARAKVPNEIARIEQEKKALLRAGEKADAAETLRQDFNYDLEGVSASRGDGDFKSKALAMYNKYRDAPNLSANQKATLDSFRSDVVRTVDLDIRGSTTFGRSLETADRIYADAIKAADKIEDSKAKATAIRAAKQAKTDTLGSMGQEEVNQLATEVTELLQEKMGEGVILSAEEISSATARALNASGRSTELAAVRKKIEIAAKVAAGILEADIKKATAKADVEATNAVARQKHLTEFNQGGIHGGHSGVAIKLFEEFSNKENKKGWNWFGDGKASQAEFNKGYDTLVSAVREHSIDNKSDADIAWVVSQFMLKDVKVDDNIVTRNVLEMGDGKDIKDTDSFELFERVMKGHMTGQQTTVYVDELISQASQLELQVDRLRERKEFGEASKINQQLQKIQKTIEVFTKKNGNPIDDTPPLIRQLRDQYKLPGQFIESYTGLGVKVPTFD